MRGGTTAHEGGSIVRWVEVDGRYLAISGLGDPFSLDTPRGAVRALIHAAVSTDLSAFEGLLDDELLARTAEDLGARIGLIATALEETDFVIGEDGQVATLAYAPGRTLSLRKIDGRWRITALE